MADYKDYIRVKDATRHWKHLNSKNIIRTADYTWGNFIPKNLLKQYKRVINIYFTFLIILQLIPIFSPYSALTTLLPFLAVLFVTMGFDFRDNQTKMKHDFLVNNSGCKRAIIRNKKSWRDDEYATVKCQDLSVGDLIILQKNDVVPANCILLDDKLVDHNTSPDDESTGNVHVETQMHDGEMMYLSIKKTMQSETSSLQKKNIPLHDLREPIQFEIMNHHDMENFNGVMKIPDQATDHKIPFSIENILLRGTKIAGTATCYAAVLQVGLDKHIFRNDKGSWKSNRLDRHMSNLIKFMALIVVIFSGVVAIIHRWHLDDSMIEFRNAYNFADEDTEENNDISGLLIFLNYVVLLSQLVPISLYVSVELIRSVQGTMIEMDTKMELSAHSHNLTEELGQIAYVLSDKTGTMTYNQLSLKAIYCEELFQALNPEDVTGNWIRKLATQRLSSEMSFSNDEKQMSQEENIYHLFMCIVLCHSAQIKQKSDQNSPPLFEAISKDEVVLLKGAWYAGFKFVKDIDENTGKLRIIEVFGKQMQYKIVQMLPFSSEKKEMVVLVEDEKNDRYIYRKGASKNEEEKAKELATEGLRTMTFKFAKRVPHTRNPDYNDDDLQILGTTGIEDALRDGVPQTITNLMEAGIRVWMLTGDQSETAKMIGYSSKLFVKHYTQIHSLLWDTQKLKESCRQARLYQFQKLVESANMAVGVYSEFKDRKHGLIVEGRVLKEILAPVFREKNLFKAMCMVDSLHNKPFLDGDIVWVKISDGIYWPGRYEERKDGNIYLTLFQRNDCGYNSDSVKHFATNFRQNWKNAKCFATNDEQNWTYQADFDRITTLAFLKAMVEAYKEWKTNVIDQDKNNRKLTLANLAVLLDVEDDIRMFLEFANLLQKNDHVHDEYVSRHWDKFHTGSNSDKDDWESNRFPIVDPEELLYRFLETAAKCSGVICSRLQPNQKLLVVDTIHKRMGKTVLAIGDGANDVPMIRAANVGVDISEKFKQGQPAKTAPPAKTFSDFSIVTFKDLERLLLVHGRWSYFRMAVFIKYFFYKTVACFLVQFWFALDNGASMQTIYDTTFITMFNVAYSSLPIIIVATFDQDVDELWCLAYPKLYYAGILERYFNSRVIRNSLLRGLIHSIVVYYVIMGSVFSGGSVDSDGTDRGDLRTVSYTMAASVVLLTNLQLALELKNWTWMAWVSILLGPLLFLLVTGAVYQFRGVFGTECIIERQETCFQSVYVGVFYRAHTRPQLYFVVVLVNTICIAPEHFYNFVNNYLYPTPADLIREYSIKRGREEDAEQIRQDYSLKLREIDHIEGVTPPSSPFSVSEIHESEMHLGRRFPPSP